MHIPDGFLNLPVAGSTIAIAGTGTILSYIAIRKTRSKPTASTTSLIGAFIFAAQMMNFPITMGTSGHLIGGAMAAILMGPVAATFIISSVLFTQCMILHDGGITALGANIINMAMVSVWSGWIAFHLMGGNKRPVMACAVAGWFSVMAAAFCCSMELVLSGMGSTSAVFSSMLGIHSAIGLGEAIITSVLVNMLNPVQDSSHSITILPKKSALALSFLTLALIVLSPFASQLPDGLNFVIQKLGLQSYSITPLLKNRVSLNSFHEVLGAILGALLVAAVGILVSKRHTTGRYPY